MKKHKIAFVIPGLDPGGAERVVSTLANELCSKYEIYIMTLWDVEPFYPLHKSIIHLKCSDSPPISKNVFHALFNNFNLIKKLKYFFSKHKIDLSIGFTTTANILAIIASQSKNIPCIISERSNPNVYILNKLWYYLRKTTYSKADFIVIQTEQNLLNFIKFTKIEKLIVLPNPLSNELVINKKCNPTKKNIVLCVGRLDKNKSQGLLIRAFNNINNKDWQLIFVGEGEEKLNYMNLAKSLNLEEKVSFVGSCATIYDHYNLSKIFAFTSQSEGFPNVLIEAMYFGLPCISTDCPSGPSEIINDNSSGFLIPVNDQNALENRLTTLMSSESIRDSIGQNGFLRAEKYLPENVIKKWDELIQKLLS